MLKALSDSSQDLALNDRWLIEVFVTDDNGYAVASAPVITVTSPTAVVTTPTVETVYWTGYYRTSVAVSTSGRWTATAVATGYGASSFAAYVSGVSATAAFPDLAAVKAYLGTDGYSVDDTQLQDALDAEAASQRQVCDVGAVYPADLRQALLRRVARNLALRGIPLAVFLGDAETGSLTPPGRDPEVRRLEAGHRKLVQP